MKVRQIQAKRDDFKIRSPVTKLGRGMGRGRLRNFKLFKYYRQKPLTTYTIYKPNINPAYRIYQNPVKKPL